MAAAEARKAAEEDVRLAAEAERQAEAEAKAKAEAEAAKRRSIDAAAAAQAVSVESWSRMFCVRLTPPHLRLTAFRPEWLWVSPDVFTHRHAHTRTHTRTQAHSHTPGT